MELQSERARRFTRISRNRLGIRIVRVDEHSANGNEISALALGLLHPSHPTFVGRVSVGRRGSERVAVGSERGEQRGVSTLGIVTPPQVICSGSRYQSRASTCHRPFPK
jgi:hypothetical protein